MRIRKISSFYQLARKRILIRKIRFARNKTQVKKYWRIPSGIRYNAQLYDILKCLGGEIGRRKGLKIPREQSRAGSIPASGTNKNNDLHNDTLSHLFEGVDQVSTKKVRPEKLRRKYWTDLSLDNYIRLERLAAQNGTTTYKMASAIVSAYLLGGLVRKVD